MNDKIINDLKTEITLSFSNRVYPGDENIAQEAVDDPHYDGNQVATFFRGKQWQDFQWKSVISTQSMDPQGFIYFMSPKAFAYYMPAFLMQALDVDNAPDLAETLTFALAPSKEADSVESKWQKEHMALFNQKELLAIEHAYQYIVAQLD